MINKGARLNRLEITVLIILTAGGLITTWYAPTIFFGARILLGPTYSLLAFLLFRGWWGIPVAIPSSLATIALFGNPLTAIRLLAEIIFISLINRRAGSDQRIREGRVIRQVVIFALLIGCPFLYVTEVFLLGSSTGVALTLAYKNFITSTFNILVAYAIYSWIELRRNKRQESSIHQISVRTLCSVLLMLTCIALSFSLITREFQISNRQIQISVAQKQASLAEAINYIDGTEALRPEDFASLIIDRTTVTSNHQSLFNEESEHHPPNEYRVIEENGLIRVMPPQDSNNRPVYFRLDRKGKAPIVQTERFFNEIEPNLAKNPAWKEIIPELSAVGPSQGSLLRRFSNSYWRYTYEPANAKGNKKIRIYTSVKPWIDDLAQLSSSALSVLSAVVVIALAASNFAASLLMREWKAILPARKRSTEPGAEDNVRDNTYKNSPITEINASVVEINERTNRILEDKRKIEYLNSITKRQLSTAADIQNYFLTKKFPENSSFEVSALTVPAYDVGGDWYDSFLVGKHSFFVVADVCDKGVGSALFMSVFRTLLRYSTLITYRNEKQGSSEDRLIQITNEVNQYMASNHGDCMYFATVFIAHLEEGSPEMKYLSAGHEDVILRKATGEQVLLSATGPALGLFTAAKYNIGACRFEEDDILAAYTDGVKDARNSVEESFGMQRISAVISSFTNETPQAMRDMLMTQLQQFMEGCDQFDDITVMFIKRLKLDSSAACPSPGT